MIGKALLQITLMLLPWSVRRPLLNRLFGYEIAGTAWIGRSLIVVDRLRMEDRSRIGHYAFLRGMREVHLEESSSLGPMTWATAVPANHPTFFKHREDRDPSLHLKRHAAVTPRHRLDCSDRITIGAFSIVAGWNTQILTHAIDIGLGIQDTAPVVVGDRCFVGSRCLLLKGSRLPDCSVLGAGSVLSRSFDEIYSLYSGVPAQRIREMPSDAAFFERQRGYV